MGDVYIINQAGRIVGVPRSLVPELLKQGASVLEDAIPQIGDDLSSAKRITMHRLGGLGDVVCMLPAAKFIKYYHPGVEVVISTSNQWAELFKGELYVDGVIDENSRSSPRGLYLDFDNDWVVGIERDQHKKGAVPRYRGQIWANHLGLKGASYAPKLHPTKNEIEWANGMWTASGQGHRIALAINASNHIKCPPARVQRNLKSTLEGLGNVMVLDDNTQGYKYTLRQVAALISTSDVMVCPDTGLVHMAIGLDARIVMLPCNTDPKTILAESAKAIAVKPACPDWPCWWDTPCAHGMQPPYGEFGGAFPCAEDFDMSQVVDAVRRHLNTPKKIFVLVLTWNNIELTRDAMESLKSFNDLEVFVVDNGSDDGTLEWLDGEGYTYTSSQSHEWGVAEALNVGMAKFVQSESDYLFVVNNDVILKRGYIDRMVDHLDNLHNAGLVVGTNVVGDQWRYDIDKFPQKDGAEDFYDLIPGDYSATMLSRKAVLDVGFFDPTFKPRYIEDNDYTTRLRLAGYKAWRTKDAFWHVLGATEKNVDRHQEAASNPSWAKNKAYYARKWGSDCHEVPQRTPVFNRAFNGRMRDPGVLAMDQAINEME